MWSRTGSPKTSFVVKQQRLNIPNILKKNINTQSGAVERVNPNDMDFSNLITFDKDSGIHSNTEINEGFLKVKAGQNSGQWVSDNFSLSANIKEIEFRFEGDYLTQQYSATTSYLWYSLDGGTTWRLNPALGETVKIPTGRDLKIRIDLNASDARVKVAGYLWK